jgi:hypothetical protein
MFHSMYDPELVYFAARLRVFRPDERDPESLLRAAEHERILRAMKAEKAVEPPRGFVARVRMAFNRA